MNRTLLLIGLLSLIVTGVASAATRLECVSVTPMQGTGLSTYTFKIVNGDGKEDACQATIAFQGVSGINQVTCPSPESKLKLAINNGFRFRIGAGDAYTSGLLHNLGLPVAATARARPQNTPDQAWASDQLAKFSAHPTDDVFLEYEGAGGVPNPVLFAWSGVPAAPNAVGSEDLDARQTSWSAFLGALSAEAEPETHVRGAYALPWAGMNGSYRDESQSLVYWDYYNWPGSQCRLVAGALWDAINPVVETHAPVLCPNYYPNWFTTDKWVAAVSKNLTFLKADSRYAGHTVEPWLYPYVYGTADYEPIKWEQWPQDPSEPPIEIIGADLTRQLLTLRELGAEGAVLWVDVPGAPVKVWCWDAALWLLDQGGAQPTIADYAVNTEAAADIYDGWQNTYYKESDSWVCAGWVGVPGVNPLDDEPVSGFYQEANCYVVAQYSVAPFVANEADRNFVQIVASGPITWTGNIKWDSDAAAISVPAGKATPQLGDFNGDGVVNQADYTTWADGYGQVDTVFAAGSSNADGLVDQADYTTWADHYGESTPPGNNMMMSMQSMQMESLLLGEGGPALAFTATDLGGGLTAYAFYISNDDELEASYAVTLAFQGAGSATIKQMLFYGAVDIDREQDATTYDGLGTPTYHKAEDCWAYEPFGANEIAGASPLDESEFDGFLRSANAYEMSLGTGANSEYGDDTAVAYIVADGDVTWTGTISRAGAEYAVSGSTEE